MGKVAALGRREARRYNRCPGCGELWVAAWMARVGLRTCPSCACVVLAYIGRSPYDDAVPRSDRNVGNVGLRSRPQGFAVVAEPPEEHKVTGGACPVSAAAPED
jgi:hypothetical protein